MVFIQKNASLFLLLLLVIAGFGLVVSAVYFQISIDKLNKAYSAKGVQLSEINKEIYGRQSELFSIDDEIKLKSNIIEDLQFRYNQLKKTNEELAEQIGFLSEQVKQASTNINSVQKKLSICEANNAQWEAAYASLKLQRNYYANLAGVAPQD